MPELPEVETIRRDLEHAVLGKGIRKVEICRSKMVKNKDQEFIKVLTGNRFDRISRKGKLLIFDLAYGDKTLLVHLRMTGQLVCEIPGGILVDPHAGLESSDLPNKHTHIIFEFADESKLFFNDLRTFGYMQLCSDHEVLESLAKYGIEPLTENFSWLNFRKVFNGRKRVLKPLLLDQSLVSGIGNIYADEICFKSKILPDRNSGSLSQAELKRIYNACQSVISKAVEKRGTSFKDYLDGSGKEGGYLPYLKVYGREGEQCLKCKDGIIEKKKLAGRGTHFCPFCQQ